jgi:16S rRNA (cytosine967-C5)-methyltransferase
MSRRGPDPAPRTARTSTQDVQPTARGVALALLGEVLRRKRPLDEALAASGELMALSPRDRAFARLLVATVLRRLPQMEVLIDHCLETPIPKAAAVVRDILTLGAAQLVVLGTPAHAAVSETVALAEAAGHKRMTGLVNAVLRRLAREGADLAAEQDAARLNTPGWLWRSWEAAYGAAAARGIAEAHLAEPPLDLTVKDDPQGWAARLGAQVLPTGSLRLPETARVSELPGFADGVWWVQDAGAALPARLLCNALGDVRGKHVIDLCAAPGGKTAQLAAAGAQVTALDRSEPRMARLRQNLDRLNLTAETVVADGASWRPAAPADAVLLDAPCSSTGTLRRHPDVARLKSPGDLAKLVPVQDRLLAAALDMVKPGGTVVYCTCSLQPEEGPERIAPVLDAGRAERVPIAADEVGGESRFLTAEGDLRTLPCYWAEKGGIDGFFAARLRRR